MVRSVTSLGLVLQRQDRFGAALILHRRALSGREEILGIEHSDILKSVWGLAYVFRRLQQYQTASHLY